MNMPLWRFIPAALFIAAGVAVAAVGTFGVFRVRYALNRLHAAAMPDSLGLLLIAAGLAVLFGFSLSTAKLLLIVLLFWLASPVCSHLLAFLETSTNEDLQTQCPSVPLDKLDDPGKKWEGRDA